MKQTNIDGAINLLSRVMEMDATVTVGDLTEEIGGALDLLLSDEGSEESKEELISELDTIITTIRRDGQLSYDGQDVNYHDALMAASQTCQDLAVLYREDE